MVDKVLQGGAWAVAAPEFGNINWPPEEATFLNMVSRKDTFYDEVWQFLDDLIARHGVAVDAEILTDLMRYQKAMLVDPHGGKKITTDLNHGFHEFFAQAAGGEKAALLPVPEGVEIEIDSEAAYAGDLIAYAREVIWYGRKKVRYLHTKVTSSH